MDLTDNEKKLRKKFLYLVQANNKLPIILDFLRKRDYVLLSYMIKTEDTTIYFPKSTWTTGRNKLREYALSLNEKYDYYIFLDEDVKFIDFPQEMGFRFFEQFLLEYEPYIANPNLLGYYPIPIDNCEAQTITWFDGMYNAFSNESFNCDKIFPYNDVFDNHSWWTSQYIMIMLFHYIKKM